MDEPFSALDALTREDLYGQLQDIWHGRTTTVVFVTHNVREAVTLGDRVVVMRPSPGHICADFNVSIARPRQIDDVEVARLAHEISAEMKSNQEWSLKGGGADAASPNDSVLYRARRPVGDRS
jgi:NitT/TauT family transport system ATP-binding protein